MTQIKNLREQATHRIEMDLLRNSIVKTRQNWERNFNQRTDLKSRPPWSQLTQAERPFPTPPRARCSPRPYLLLGRGPRRGQSPRNIWVVSDINKSNFPRFFSLRHLKNCRSGPGTTKIFLPCRDWKCCRGPRPALFFSDHPPTTQAADFSRPLAPPVPLTSTQGRGYHVSNAFQVFQRTDHCMVSPHPISMSHQVRSHAAAQTNLQFDVRKYKFVLISNSSPNAGRFRKKSSWTVRVTGAKAVGNIYARNSNYNTCKDVHSFRMRVQKYSGTTVLTVSTVACWFT